MKKFIALYYAPASTMAAMANVSPEDQAKTMEAWYAWKEKSGDHIVDFGAPLMPGQHLSPTNNWSASSKEVTGYSLLQGESEADVKALFVEHPHLSWAEGCSIEVHEFAAM